MTYKNQFLDVIFFGPQGAGKGTQVAKLWGKYGKDNSWFRVQTGDIFREIRVQETELGKKVQELLDAGFLVPDDITVEIVSNKLNHEEVKSKNWIFDGFPRTLKQAEFFFDFYSKLENRKLVVISIFLSYEEAITRIEKRLVCVKCKAIASKVFGLSEGSICKHCGIGTLEHRADEKDIESIKKRLELFETQTLPVYDFFQSKGVEILKIDGSPSIKEVHETIVDLLKPTEYDGIKKSCDEEDKE
ncbi:MAG: adenylate kinase [Patescibacteria group bacterium]